MLCAQIMQTSSTSVTLATKWHNDLFLQAKLQIPKVHFPLRSAHSVDAVQLPALNFENATATAFSKKADVDRAVQRGIDAAGDDAAAIIGVDLHRGVIDEDALVDTKVVGCRQMRVA